MGRGGFAQKTGGMDGKERKTPTFSSKFPPYLLKAADNPEGVDGSAFEGIQKAILADRYAFFPEFFKNFYNTDQYLGTPKSLGASPWTSVPGSGALSFLKGP